QDTAGPMARTVTDAAILMGVLEGTGPDANDSAMGRCAQPRDHDYTPHLKRDGLRGARIGIPRAFFYDKATPPGESTPRGGLNDEQARVMAEAIEVLKREGAVVVDPADIPSIVDPDPAKNFMLWGICSGASGARATNANCSTVFNYGMKRDFNAWLRSLGPGAPVRSLAELRNFNVARTSRGTLKYGQNQLDNSDEMDLDADRARYEADRARDLQLAGSNGIDAVMKQHQLDALLFPAQTGANIAARPGYPTVIVPFGMVRNAPAPPLPDGFEARPSPFGVSFTGSASSAP